MMFQYPYPQVLLGPWHLILSPPYILHHSMCHNLSTRVQHQQSPHYTHTYHQLLQLQVKMGTFSKLETASVITRTVLLVPGWLRDQSSSAWWPTSSTASWPWWPAQITYLYTSSHAEAAGMAKFAICNYFTTYILQETICRKDWTNFTSEALRP